MPSPQQYQFPGQLYKKNILEEDIYSGGRYILLVFYKHKTCFYLQVLRRVEEAKAIMEEQMMQELQNRKEQQLKEAARREVGIKLLRPVA